MVTIIVYTIELSLATAQENIIIALRTYKHWSSIFITLH